MLRLDVRPDAREAHEHLPWCERLVIDLPDREVWVASTSSRTAGANHARVNPEHARDDSDQHTGSELHRRTIAYCQLPCSTT
jgi:hypothetical protein